MREAGAIPDDPPRWRRALKACPFRADRRRADRARDFERGRRRWSAIDERFMLRALPGVFVAGEMIDWEAPTGGYLLQAAFATGAAAGRGAAERLAAAV